VVPFETFPNACVIGIDPGVTGAIAFLDTQRWTLGVIDMPTISLVVNGKDRNEPAPSAISGLVRQIKPILLVSEKLQNMGTASPASEHSKILMGRWRGQLEGIVAALEVPHEHPYPQEWKKALGLTSNKELSRTRANALFPKCTDFWRFKKDHDRAEAALLSIYGCFKLGIMPNKAIKPMTILTDEDE
jgi:crossover junction endodeoxyribonuclease RuvC